MRETGARHIHDRSARGIMSSMEQSERAEGATKAHWESPFLRSDRGLGRTNQVVLVIQSYARTKPPHAHHSAALLQTRLEVGGVASPLASPEELKRSIIRQKKAVRFNSLVS